MRKEDQRRCDDAKAVSREGRGAALGRGVRLGLCKAIHADVQREMSLTEKTRASAVASWKQKGE